MQKEIFDAIRAALEDLGASEVDFVVERPADFSHGDYATNAALVAAKKQGKNLKEVAEELLKKLSVAHVEKIEIAGPGFINFYLSKETIGDVVAKSANGDSWGINNSLSGKKILVEYTSPNLFKPLHIGNLVGNVLGESIARLLEVSGAHVERVNYPSDIGLTVAKGVWGLQKKALDPEDIAQLGQAYVFGNTAYEEDEAAKKEIEAINRKLYENSDQELSVLRKVGIETSRRHLDELCKRLGTTFNIEFFESQSAPLGRDVVSAHVDDGIFEKSDGAVIYKGEKDGLHTRVFLNSQGLPTYEAKEVGLFELKADAYPAFDWSLTVTGKEQAEFFKVVFAALRKLFPDKTNGKILQQVSNGYLKLTTGKMSSRKGNVITGESLLMDLKDAAKEKIGERALENPDKVAEQVAVGAIKYAVLKQGSGRDIIFDPEKSLSLEGDSGPYLQYARVRALSLMDRAQKAKVAAEERHEYDTFFASGASNTLARIVLHFPEVVEHAASELEPHFVTTYLTELASAFNSWYASERVIVDGAVATAPLYLVMAVENTLNKGLKILGIPTPEEM